MSEQNTAIIVSSIIFAATLLLIFTEKIHRTIVGLAGAGLMIAAGIVWGFYSEEEAVTAVDFETLALLFGMMVLVALLQPTGFFEYLAIKVGRWSKGNSVYLLILLGTVTTVLSMFLDNVTTVVLIAPVTILISEILALNPAPFLIAEAILANTGGAGTLVGDPPNVLIGSAVELTFMDFITHALPIVLICWVAVLLLLLYQFRHDLVTQPGAAKRVYQLDPAKALDHPMTARKVVIVLGIAVLLFFVHHLFRISPAFVAMGGAATALLWTRPKNMNEVLAHVEWPVLLFFASLFIMVGGLEAVGVLNIALIPVLFSLGRAGINIVPLWWALVFGAGFGGNGTIIGSTANVVVVSLSERTKKPITAVQWSKHGLPAMILACTVASIIYVLFYGYFAGG
ncbi:MAG: ArsB/NhaD family transporter [Chloroflexi bacterium]|nr:ArsB/NhaD family transporter [Chloroflexota bacterium]